MVFFPRVLKHTKEATPYQCVGGLTPLENGSFSVAGRGLDQRTLVRLCLRGNKCLPGIEVVSAQELYNLKLFLADLIPISSRQICATTEASIAWRSAAWFEKPNEALSSFMAGNFCLL